MSCGRRFCGTMAARAGECIELERREPRSRAITGNIMMPGFTAPKLLWVSRHEPQIFARTARVLLPKDYVRLKLTGEAVSDMSDAAGTGWLDVAARDWSDEMLAATGLDRSHMPRLVEGNAPSATVRSEAAAQLQIPSVVVAGGAGDNAASAVGMGIIAPGQAFLSLGTSGVLFVVTDRFRPNPEQGSARVLSLPARTLASDVGNAQSPRAPWTGWRSCSGEPDLQRLVASAQASGLRRTSPYFLPYLSGERTPHNDPQCARSILRLEPGDYAG